MNTEVPVLITGTHKGEDGDFVDCTSTQFDTNASSQRCWAKSLGAVHAAHGESHILHHCYAKHLPAQLATAQQLVEVLLCKSYLPCCQLSYLQHGLANLPLLQGVCVMGKELWSSSHKQDMIQSNYSWVVSLQATGGESPIAACQPIQRKAQILCVCIQFVYPKYPICVGSRSPPMIYHDTHNYSCQIFMDPTRGVWNDFATVGPPSATVKTYTHCFCLPSLTIRWRWGRVWVPWQRDGDQRW